MNTILKEIKRMDNGDISTLIKAIEQRQEVLSREAAASLVVGDKVTFELNGKLEPGVVHKVKRKNIEVNVLDGSMRYNVPATMLTKVLS